MEDTAGWLTEKQLIAETGEGKFTLDRLRRAGIVPWDRRFFGFPVGSLTVYPPIAVAIIRSIQRLRRQFKGVDRQHYALWADEGYPVDIVRWHTKRLLRLEKLSDRLAKENIRTAAVDAAVKGRLRRKPHQTVFNQMRQPQARQALLEWGATIGAGLTPPASIYIPGSPAQKAFSKAISSAEPPDPSLEIEKMSFARLHEIVINANIGQIESGRLDCNRLAGLVRIAASLDWSRVREAFGVTHQGGPATPIAPFERLIRLWENLDFRACLLPFLMFVRTRPGYRFELDERFASLEIELRALSEYVGSSVTTPQQPASSDARQ
jgi:hypothetical protein